MPDLRPAIPSIGAMFRLDGLTAVITGGGSGIGRGAAHALRQAGADSRTDERSSATQRDPARGSAHRCE